MKIRIQSKDGTKLVDLNRRKAIRENCLNCSAWSVKSVRDCQRVGCSLFSFLSGIGQQDATERRKAIRQYCMWCCAGQRSEVSHCPVKDCPLYAYRKSKIDKSVNIGITEKNHHIERFGEHKNLNLCLSMRKTR